MLKTRLIAPYQHDGVKWLVGRETVPVLGGGFLCDEMGLGKTVQLLATMCVNPKAHTLVIVPKSIVGQWCDEIRRFTPHLTVHAFDGMKRYLPDVRPHIVVAPYSVVIDSALTRVEWDRVILDEAHEIRNRRSKIHVACCALRAPIRWVVTGTPVFNSIRDFVALCQFLGIDRYAAQGDTEGVRQRYVLRRTKDDVAKFNPRLALPPCDFENVELEMHPQERALYSDVFAHSQDVVASVAQSTAAHMFQMELLEALLRTRQAMIWPQLYLDGLALKEGRDPEPWCGASRKMETLTDLIHSHPKEKALVFCQFMGEMDEIQTRLTTARVPIFRIDGGIPREKRIERIKGFKAAAENAVFLIQIKAGGVGLNLQEATRVYITAPSWNPATELQAIGRAHRTGQTHKVVVRRLIYVGSPELPSVEQSIMQLQGGKARVCAEVLNDKRLTDQVPCEPKKAINIQTLKRIFAV